MERLAGEGEIFEMGLNMRRREIRKLKRIERCTPYKTRKEDTSRYYPSAPSFSKIEVYSIILLLAFSS